MKIVCFKARRAAVYLGLFALALGVLWIMQAAGSYAIAAMTTARSLPIYSVEKEEKKISISFDCAWGVEYTDELLKTMEQNGVKCT